MTMNLEWKTWFGDNWSLLVELERWLKELGSDAIDLTNRVRPLVDSVEERDPIDDMVEISDIWDS